ncbi:MAG: hypothetical protein Q7S02_03545 [bacterium]|nr:hypothetical protein [bacterium]
MSGAAVLLVFLGLARLIVAIVEGNAEGYVGGTISAIGLWAIAGMVFWLNHDGAHRAQQEPRNAKIIPLARRSRSPEERRRNSAA